LTANSLENKLTGFGFYQIVHGAPNTAAAASKSPTIIDGSVLYQNRVTNSLTKGQ
jgi:hypothetical protein